MSSYLPQFEARRLHQVWRPILNHIEQQTGYRLELVGSPTIPAFEAEFFEGKFDFVYMNPYHVMLGSDTQGYRPLVRDVGKTLYGVLVALKGGPIHSVKDLQSKTLAFPAPNALAASLQMRQELVDQFSIDFSAHYVKTHDSVYLNCDKAHRCGYSGQSDSAKRQFKWSDAIQIIDWPT